MWSDQRNPEFAAVSQRAQLIVDEADIEAQGVDAARLVSVARLHCIAGRCRTGALAGLRDVHSPSRHWRVIPGWPTLPSVECPFPESNARALQSS